MVNVILYQLSYKWWICLWTGRSLLKKKNWDTPAGDSTSQARLQKGRETLKKRLTFSI